MNNNNENEEYLGLGWLGIIIIYFTILIGWSILMYIGPIIIQTIKQ